MTYSPPVQIKDALGNVTQEVFSESFATFTNTPLGPNQSWTSGWLPFLGYQSIVSIVFADQPSAAGGQSFLASSDGGVTVFPQNPGTYTRVNESVISIFPAVRGSHVRLTFTNGPVAQTAFFAAIRFQTGASTGSISSMWNGTSGAMTAQSVKALLTLPNSNVVNSPFDFITRTGNSVNVNVTNLGSSFYNNQNVNETRTLKSGNGILRKVIINNPTTGTIDLYNSLSGSGAKIASIAVAGTQPFSLPYDLPFSVGLTYVSASTPGDFTVVYD